MKKQNAKKYNSLFWLDTNGSVPPYMGGGANFYFTIPIFINKKTKKKKARRKSSKK